MSHQGYEESPERWQHRDVKCFRGERDALDRVCQLDEEHKKRCHRERSGFNGHKTTWAQSGKKETGS